jgi:hypothetical protein
MAPHNSDILFGHNTWDDYQCAGPRIFKHYSFPVLSYLGDSGLSETNSEERNYDPSLIHAKTVEMLFSSSPGFLTSMDDFFLVSGPGDLAIMETR